jgi:hypothetical protein
MNLTPTLRVGPLPPSASPPLVGAGLIGDNYFDRSTTTILTG